MPERSAQERYQDVSASIRGRLRSCGFDRAGIAANLPEVIDTRIERLLRSQPEHDLTPGAYVDRLLTPERVAQGQYLFTEISRVLREIESRYGVPGAICLAIWGIETNYGTAMGDWPVIGSLAALAAIDARRREFWSSECETAVNLLCTGEQTLRVLNGSWAGAMGHVQFMPSTYDRYAVDFDCDGIADIWNSPPDALASAANYLFEHGWQPEQSPVREALASPSFDWSMDLKASRPMQDWAAIGLRLARVDAAVANDETLLRLIAPEGARGPLFLAGRNLDSLLAYNNSIPYALSVSLLGARIARQVALVTPWRSPDHGLSREEKVQLQRHLSLMGWDTGGVDGILGVRSRDAVRELQKVLGLSVDGYADRELLDALAASGLSGAIT